MVSDTLTQVQRLVDRLTPLEQVRLLAYLTSRIGWLIESMNPNASTSVSSSAAAWKEFFRLGDELAASDTPESPTLTSVVQTTRR